MVVYTWTLDRKSPCSWLCTHRKRYYYSITKPQSVSLSCDWLRKYILLRSTWYCETSYSLCTRYMTGRIFVSGVPRTHHQERLTDRNTQICVFQHATRAGGAQAPRRGPPEGPRRAAGGEKIAIYARICAWRPSNKLRSNASLTSKRRVSGCLRMSWSRNELITLALLKSGVARGQHRCTQANR